MLTSEGEVLETVSEGKGGEGYCIMTCPDENEEPTIPVEWQDIRNYPMSNRYTYQLSTRNTVERTECVIWSVVFTFVTRWVWFNNKLEQLDNNLSNSWRV